MAFYDLNTAERAHLVKEMEVTIQENLTKKNDGYLLKCCNDDDTYIRKAAYLCLGRIYLSTQSLQPAILQFLKNHLSHHDYKVRQTVINAAGEIGKKDFEAVQPIFDKGLFDEHHSPRNAVIGSVKKMGEVNPAPVLHWAQTYLHHPDKEIRREICHGIELRGRKYPQDILPLLQELEWDDTKRVSATLVHVLGQISYKKGCLQMVVAHLKQWKNTQLVEKALEEIIDVHHRYKQFSFYTQQQAIDYIEKNF